VSTSLWLWLQDVSTSLWLQSMSTSLWLQGVSTTLWLQNVSTSLWLRDASTSLWLLDVSTTLWLRDASTSLWLQMCLLACGCQMCLPAWGARCLLACGCTGWPLAAYVLIGRDDIAATVQASMALPPEGATPQSSLPLATPVSSLALATPLHHGAGGGASPNRPSLGRTPIRQPQLGTLQGEAHHNAIVLLGAATLCLSSVCRLQQQLLTSQQCSNGRSHSCAGLLFVHTLMTKEDTDCMLEATALPDP